MGIPSDSLNVSEHRAIEDQLREAEGRFRTLVEHATDGMMTTLVYRGVQTPFSHGGSAGNDPE